MHRKKEHSWTRGLLHFQKELPAKEDLSFLKELLKLKKLLFSIIFFDFRVKIVCERQLGF